MVPTSAHKIASKVTGKNTKSCTRPQVRVARVYLSLGKRRSRNSEKSTQESGSIEQYNPWPGFHYTGKLRPYPLVITVRISGDRLDGEPCFRVLVDQCHRPSLGLITPMIPKADRNRKKEKNQLAVRSVS